MAAATAETDVAEGLLVYFAACERKITLSLDLLEQRFFFIFFVLEIFVGFVEVQFFLQLLCFRLVALSGLLGKGLGGVGAALGVLRGGKRLHVGTGSDRLGFLAVLTGLRSTH